MNSLNSLVSQLPEGLTNIIAKGYAETSKWGSHILKVIQPAVRPLADQMQKNHLVAIAVFTFANILFLFLVHQLTKRKNDNEVEASTLCSRFIKPVFVELVLIGGGIAAYNTILSKVTDYRVSYAALVGVAFAAIALRFMFKQIETRTQNEVRALTLNLRTVEENLRSMTDEKTTLETRYLEACEGHNKFNASALSQKTDLEQRLEQTEENLQLITQQKDGLQTQYQTTLEEYNEFKVRAQAEQADLTARLKQAEQNLQSMAQDNAALEAQQQAAASVGNNGSKAQTIAELTLKLQQAENNFQLVTKEKADLQGQYQVAIAEHNAFKVTAQIEQTELKEKLAQIEQSLQSLTQEKVALEAQYRAALKALEEEKHKLEADLLTAQRNIRKLTKERDDYQTVNLEFITGGFTKIESQVRSLPDTPVAPANGYVQAASSSAALTLSSSLSSLSTPIPFSLSSPSVLSSMSPNRKSPTPAAAPLTPKSTLKPFTMPWLLEKQKGLTNDAAMNIFIGSYSQKEQLKIVALIDMMEKKGKLPPPPLPRDIAPPPPGAIPPPPPPPPPPTTTTTSGAISSATPASPHKPLTLILTADVLDASKLKPANQSRTGATGSVLPQPKTLFDLRDTIRAGLISKFGGIGGGGGSDNEGIMSGDDTAINSDDDYWNN